MQFSIEPLDAAARGPQFDSALALRQALTAERDPALDPDTAELFRGAIRGNETFEIRSLLAVADGEVVAMAEVHLYRLATNADRFEVQLEVHPAFRRRGIGTRLLAAVVELGAADGRTSLAAINVDCEECRAFWRARGAELKLIERQSRLWLADTDAALMRSWVARRERRAGDYRLEHYRGRTPDHLLAAAVDLNNAMNDAPIDDLDWEDDVWTVDDVVQLDELIMGRGRERWATIALGPNDEPAGLTAISTQFEKPRFALQGNTVVDPAHRNRGLGRWLKADMWLRLRSDAPQIEAIDTDNAASNDAMLAINTEMGFAPLYDWGFWQAALTDLR